MPLQIGRVIRRVAAVLLLVALSLPLSRCAEQREQGDQDDTGATSYKYYYAWTDFNIASASDWLLIVSFIWPVAILLYEVFAKKMALQVWVTVLQALLAAGAIYMVYLRTFLHNLWYGGYIAYCALGLYFLVSLFELVYRIYLKSRSAAAGRPGRSV